MKKVVVLSGRICKGYGEENCKAAAAPATELGVTGSS
jgi:hypothetical protein